MNNRTVTPLDTLRSEKQKLKDSCRKQEAKLHTTLEYVEDNLIPISLGATARAFANPAKLVSSFKSSPSDEKPESGVGAFGLIPKGILGFVLKAAFGFLVKKKFGKKSVTGKILGTALPLAAPVATSAWQFSQPYILNFVKSGLSTFFAWKNKKARKR